MNIRTGVRRIFLLAVIISAPAFPNDTIVFGPTEPISLSTKVIAVLGQDFRIGESTKFCLTANPGDSMTKLFNQMVGTGMAAFVAAYQDLDGSLIATDVCIAPATYVPGADDVFVEGAITAVNIELATIEIAGVEIYFGSIADTSTVELSLGKRLMIRGRQPAPGGAVWATEITRAKEIGSRQLSAGVESITGAGTQSITGTGIQSITGTGTQSITGTGIQSITGTGTQSITGTGIQSITGTGTQSITGTGTQSSAGTQSITGTGRHGRSSSSTQSITGTGRHSTIQ